MAVNSDGGIAMVRQLRRSYRWVAEEVAVGMMLGRSEQRREEEGGFFFIRPIFKI